MTYSIEHSALLHYIDARLRASYQHRREIIKLQYRQATERLALARQYSHDEDFQHWSVVVRKMAAEAQADPHGPVLFEPLDDD